MNERKKNQNCKIKNLQNVLHEKSNTTATAKSKKIKYNHILCYYNLYDR